MNGQAEDKKRVGKESKEEKKRQNHTKAGR